MLSAVERLRAEVGKAAAPIKESRPRQKDSFDLFAEANAQPTSEVLGWLGYPNEERGEKTYTTCVGCGEPEALICEHGGVRCMHARCGEAGPVNFRGFRTNVDLVMAVRNLDKVEAAKSICERFGVEVPKANGHAAEQPSKGSAPDSPTEGEPPALRTLGDLLTPAIERAELRRSGVERPVPVPFPQYAEILNGGLFPGVHSMVAGTAVGKSTLAFQGAVHAAEAGVPVLYIGLELGEMQVALRTLAEASGTSWSRMYTGRCSVKDLDRAREAIPALASLPFYVEFSSAHGWAPSNLVARAEQIRKVHPNGPMLVVLDFLQLVGAEIVESGRSPELRERIARAAYCGVHVANRYGAAVQLISSAARDKYALLAGDAKSAGLTTRTLPGHVEPVRTILNPDALIGLGKESGEIEYAAETQTVLVRWPSQLDNGEKVVICAVPKLRYGPPSWVAMTFGQRFHELPFRTIEELPEVTARGGKGAPVPDDELEGRVLAAIRSAPNLISKNDIANITKGTKANVLRTIGRLLEEGKINKLTTGFSVVGPENR